MHTEVKYLNFIETTIKESDRSHDKALDSEYAPIFFPIDISIFSNSANTNKNVTQRMFQ